MTEVVVEPTAMAAGGAALARDAEGRVVFVEGALPGERVRAEVTEVRKDFARAVTREVLDPSADRVAPPCAALAAGCGGCTWQHVAPGAQVRLKTGIVVDALRRIGRLAAPPAPQVVPLAGPSLRTTARVAVSPAGRPGHRPRHGAGAVETDGCGAVHPLLEELILSCRFPGATEVLLRVGVATGERLAVVDRLDGPAQAPADVAVAVKGERRRLAVHEVVADRCFRISAGSFFQPGPAAAEALVAAMSTAARGALAAGGVLVDAYAGVGLFGSVLGARHGARVVAIEHDQAAVGDARSNLADLDAQVVSVEVGRWRACRADLVVGDPSRTGLGRPGVSALARAKAPRLVLVSCDPASLARDTVLLAEAGYRLVSVALVDSFPDTFHVETVSRFDR